MTTHHVSFSQPQLLDYLSSLPLPTRETLYSSSYTCRAVFRALDSVSKTFVLRLLSGLPVSSSAIASWADGGDAHQAFERLKGVGVLVKFPGKETFTLTGAFKEGIGAALCGGGEIGGMGVKREKGAVDEEKVAQEKWNAVLGFLVAESGANEASEEEERKRRKPAQGRDGKRVKSGDRVSFMASTGYDPGDLDRQVQEALIKLNFVSGANNSITSDGYEFLLKDSYEQVWTLIQYFCAQTETAPALRLLFKMSFFNPGDTMTLSHDELIHVKESIRFFSSLGLMIKANPDGLMYRLSSLGVYAVLGPSTGKRIHTAAEVSKTADNGGGDGGSGLNAARPHKSIGLAGMRIIVETTFKVYCYTTSPMHALMLELFCELEAQLPNLVVGMITRTSVSRAFQKGITAEQIILFLHQNAHPATYTKRKKIVPDNVTDQIVLWKGETNRITVTKGFFYTSFIQQTTLETVKEHSKQWMVWNDSKSFFVATENKPKVDEFIKTKFPMKR